MIDLTPLDVRNKRGDFKRIMRGYDPHEVDIFLELAAERLEALVRENMQLRERTQTLKDQVETQAGREQAVQDALVTAQELRSDMRAQSEREVEHVLKAAESEARRILAEADADVRTRVRDVERQLDRAHDSLHEAERRRERFLREFRGLLERELDVVMVEEGRMPLEDRTIDLELGGSQSMDRGEVLGASSGPVVEEPVDISELHPGLRPVRTAGPVAHVKGEPSSLELEIVAGASRGDQEETSPGPNLERFASDQFLDVPDLETVLAEAGAEEPQGSGDLVPPPIEGRRDDNLILFDSDEKNRNP